MQGKRMLEVIIYGSIAYFFFMLLILICFKNEFDRLIDGELDAEEYPEARSNQA